ncbi:hypothetical protein J5X84_33770 [Streptosporangiaceae bacterium NEAU-GS5]|nr:hypothetical protein [Streptosporangiaceae bacterium NEAU-GS5]
MERTLVRRNTTFRKESRKMTMKRWIAAVGVAAAMTTGALAVTATPASASPLSVVRNGCWDMGGDWYDFGSKYGSRARYGCVSYSVTGWMIFFYKANGMYTSMNYGSGPISFNPQNVRTP